MTTESAGVIEDPRVAGGAAFTPSIDPGDGAPLPDGVSPALYNGDLAPTKREGRRWGAYNIFTLWANDVHSLGNYVFAIGLFAGGLGGWQILVALGLGGLFLFLLLNLSGFMGEKTGVPFPVMSRISFGIRGAQIPALVRGAVAIAWFGIQTYLASVVLRIMIIALFPSSQSWDTNNFLGLSTLGWASFVSLWIIQLIIVSYGMEMIRKYEAFAGPVILFTMVALAVWLLSEADWTIAWTAPNALTGGAMWAKIIGGASLWVAIYGTFVLNFCDFTRNATSKGSIVRGNFWGIPLNMLLFGGIVITLAGAQFRIDGTVIQSPADIVQTVPNTLLLVLACLALLILTVAVNMMANFVAPIYALNNLLPKAMNFRRAALVSAVIGLVILPWNLYNNPDVVEYFLGALGALLGPLFGIVMADYWLARRGQINVPDLFTESPECAYYYTNGVNMRAVAAFIPTAGVALVLAFVPAMGVVAEYSWFIGAGLGALVYFVVADRRGPFADVSGEDIAVASTH